MDQPFKVANVICRFNSSSGGPPRTVSLIAQAGSGQWLAELFTTDYTEPRDDTLLIREFPGHVNLLGRNAQTLTGGALLAFSPSAGIRAQVLMGANANVIHLHGLWSPMLYGFARLARAGGIPYVVAPHGMLEPWSLSMHARRKRLALRTYQGWVMAGAAAIHTTSDAEAEHVRRLGYTSAPIFVIPNAVEEPANWTRPRAAGGRPVLLFLSRLHEKKGLDNLLQVWRDLKPADWDLRIVGHGEAGYVGRLQAYCVSQGVPNVTFHPHADGDLRERMFAEASAFVLPTFSENFGNAVAEAMLRGLPVITTTGTPWSVIKERGLGWYIAPSQSALATAVRELLTTDRQALIDMGARAREYAREHLLVDAVRPKLMEMYRSALQSGVRARSTLHESPAQPARL